MAGENILIVEDEKIVAKNLQGRLVNLGYQVLDIASSGEEALHKAFILPIDLVLMDIQLEGEMDGIDAAAEIQARRKIPIIYLTAYADQDTLQRAKVTEPFGYIVKPFIEKELYTSIEITLYKHKAELEREKLITELQQALSKIRTLRGLLPICASCKNIRDDQGYWHQLETYIRQHSDVEFTHGICPDCMVKYYPDYA